jgi:hypothetical protein
MFGCLAHSAELVGDIARMRLVCFAVMHMKAKTPELARARIKSISCVRSASGNKKRG